MKLSTKTLILGLCNLAAAVSLLVIVLLFIPSSSPWFMLLVGITLGLALVTLLLVFFSLGLLSSLKQFTRATQEIITGNYVKRISVEGGHELQELGSSFNTLTDKLLATQQAFQEQLHQKTIQLMGEIKNVETERLRDEAILASIGQGLVATNKQGKITLFNKAAENMLGWTSSEALDRSVEEILQIEYKQDNAGPQPQIQQVIDKDRHISNSAVPAYSLYFIRKDKSKFPAAITTTSVVMKRKILGTITLFRDITVEQEIDRMKTEFISLASHQLRTPLSAIKWFTEMLLHGDAGKLLPEQQEFAQNISESTERMIELVNSLLNISRIESGRIIIDPKPTDLKKLIHDVVYDVSAKVKERNQHLVISVAETIPIINLDPRLIRQVYMNLLTNAIKYTPQGGEIAIIVSKKEGDIISQVSDNGYGIPEEQHHRVFEKFYRGDNVIKFETDGSGLGLYLVKAIIESSHGKIWFKSTVNKGTTFWFSLPMSGMIAKKGEVTLDN